MSDIPNEPTAQELWNRASHLFLEGRTSSGSIDYGVFSPMENELNLLAQTVGDLRGQSVLDAGCGDGDNAICLAQMGAHVTALDFSQPQLVHAQRQAQSVGVQIEFVLGDVATLNGIPDASQDLVLSTHVLAYLERAGDALSAFERVLRPGGSVIISVEHPVHACFYEDGTSDMTNYPERSYFDAGPRRWNFIHAGYPMRSYERTIGQWIDLLHRAGFSLLRLLEPATPAAILDGFFPEDGPLASLRNIPHTLILAAGKPRSQTNQSRSVP